MEFIVYIIFSSSVDRYYVGHCQDLTERMERHNGGRSNYTKMACDWEVKWTEGFATRSDAMAREKEIKAKKSRKYVEFLIEQGNRGQSVPKAFGKANGYRDRILHRKDKDLKQGAFFMNFVIRV